MIEPYFRDERVTLWHGDSLDVLRQLEADSVNCCVTSPPYFGLRDYGISGQYGHEVTVDLYVERLRSLFAEVRRVLAPDGTLWLNLGDIYAGKANAGESVGETRGRGRHVAIPKRINTTASAPYKSLLGVPWRVAFALQSDGWIIRNAIVWHKPNAMPESVVDRLSSRHELLFLLTPNPSYFFDLDPIREPLAFPERTGHRFGGNSSGVGARRGATYDKAPSLNGGRNPGDVWSISTTPFAEAHFATFPLALAERCVKAGCKPGGVVLDPFSGSGTTGVVALRNGLGYVGIDLNAEYLEMSLTSPKRGLKDQPKEQPHMMTQAQKAKKIKTQETKIADLGKKVEALKKLSGLETELAYEKNALAVLQSAPVSDDIADAADYVTPDDEPAVVAAPEPEVASTLI